MDFLLARAKGEVPTGAKFMREYILQHPLYKKDSKISPMVQKELIQQVIKLNHDDHNICPLPDCDCEKQTDLSEDDCQEMLGALLENERKQKL